MKIAISVIQETTLILLQSQASPTFLNSSTLKLRLSGTLSSKRVPEEKNPIFGRKVQFCRLSEVLVLHYRTVFVLLYCNNLKRLNIIIGKLQQCNIKVMRVSYRNFCRRLVYPESGKALVPTKLDKRGFRVNNKTSS